MKPIFNHALWWAAAAVVLLAGCTKDPSVGISGEGMYISLSVDGHALSANTNASNAARRTSANASTRATAVDENVVNDLWILQFQQNSPSDAPLLRKRYIASVTDPSKVGYAPVLGSKMTLILLANTGDPTLFDATPEGNSSLEELDVLLLAHVLNVTAATGQNYPTDASANLPMLGMTENLMTFPMQEEALPVSLMRSATKVVLTVKNPCAADYPQVTVSSVQLRNVPKIGMFIPAGPEWKIDGTTDAYRYPTADAANFMDYTALTGAVDAAGTTTTVYMAPNARGKGTNTDPRLKSDATAPSGQGPYCTYVEILGTAKASATAPAVDVRYRLYPGEDNTASFNLFANRAYKVDIEITGVNPNDARMTITTDRFDLGVNGPDGDHSGDVGGWGEPASVGDYYYDDGTHSAARDSGKTAVGVIYWVDSENPLHYKVMAPSNAAAAKWAANDAYVLGSAAQDKTARNGASIVALAKAYSANNTGATAPTSGVFATDFPAMGRCQDYTSGALTSGSWFLPSAQEMLDMFTVKDVVTPVLTTLSGAFPSGEYRSATENYGAYAWGVDMSSNEFSNASKTYREYNVRCIREITLDSPDPKVGDYCYADGSWSTALASGKTPIGMIFWIHPSDPRNFKIHSLDEPPADWNNTGNDVGKLCWSTESLVSNATDVDDGMKNMATIRALNPGLAKYPAFEWCHRKDMGDQSGWYLPAKSELQYLWCAYNGKAAVKWGSGTNAAAPVVAAAQIAWDGRLTAAGVGGTQIGVGDVFYITSTEREGYSDNMWIIDWTNGETIDSDRKISDGNVRCIREFPTPPRVPAVGDFYYSDGTYSAGLDTSKKTTGMIFWVDPANPKRFKVFALRMDGAGQLWAASDDYVVGPAAQSMDDGRANSDAIRAYFEANKGGIVSETTFAAAFPAAAYCYNDRGETDTDPVGTWYLPALNELEYMYCAYNGALPTLWGVGATSITTNADAKMVCNNWLQAAAKANTGRTIDSYFDPAIHYTSTENSSDTRYAWGVDFQNGNAEDSYDHKDYFTPWVRCIREVK